MALFRPYSFAFYRRLGTRNLATAVDTRPPQTLIEKIVQRYVIGLPPGKVVKAGDYVMIRPEHVMSHDNTGPVISKFVHNSSSTIGFRPDDSIGSNLLGLPVFTILGKQFSHLITTYKTNLTKISPNMLQ